MVIVQLKIVTFYITIIASVGGLIYSAFGSHNIRNNYFLSTGSTTTKGIYLNTSSANTCVINGNTIIYPQIGFYDAGTNNIFINNYVYINNASSYGLYTGTNSLCANNYFVNSSTGTNVGVHANNSVVINNYMNITGIYIFPNVTNIWITGNVFAGSGVVNNSTNMPCAIEKNFGISMNFIASASSVALLGFDYVQFTGTTNITNINSPGLYHGQSMVFTFSNSITLSKTSLAAGTTKFLLTADYTEYDFICI